MLSVEPHRVPPGIRRSTRYQLPVVCVYSVGKSVNSGERDIVLMIPWSGETGREVQLTSGARTKAASSHATSERCTQSDQCNVPITAISR